MSRASCIPVAGAGAGWRLASLLGLLAACGGGTGLDGHDARGGDPGDAATADAGSPADATAPGGCVRPPGGPADRHVLRFQSRSPPLRIHLERRLAGPGIGESVEYELLGLWIERDGACIAMTAASQLGYMNSHHNFRDRAQGIDAGTEYRIAIDFDLDRLLWLASASAVDTATGAARLEPTPLVTTGGPVSVWVNPAFLPVHISELVPNNVTGRADKAGDLDPWVELFNPSSELVNLAGYTLSASAGGEEAWTFPEGTVIGRHQRLLVTADGEPEEGPLHTPFRLSSQGGTLRLAAPTGTTPGERHYGPTAPDQSLVYTPAIDGFQEAGAPTPGH